MEKEPQSLGLYLYLWIFSCFLRATKSLSEMRITARTIKIIPSTSMAKKWSPMIKIVKMTDATGSTYARRLPFTAPTMVVPLRKTV